MTKLHPDAKRRLSSKNSGFSVHLDGERAWHKKNTFRQNSEHYDMRSRNCPTFLNKEYKEYREKYPEAVLEIPKHIKEDALRRLDKENAKDGVEVYRKQRVNRSKPTLIRKSIKKYPIKKPVKRVRR